MRVRGLIGRGKFLGYRLTDQVVRRNLRQPVFPLLLATKQRRGNPADDHANREFVSPAKHAQLV